VPTNYQKPHEEPDGEDSGGDGNEHSSGSGSFPGLADRLARAPRELLCMGHGSSEESSFAGAPAAVSSRPSSSVSESTDEENAWPE
jgi:hypothetical protein